MITDQFPTDPQPLWRQVVRGARETIYDKPAIFDPEAIQTINYSAGRHVASPTGRVVREAQRQVKLLHYKSLGVDYVCARNLALSAGLRARDIESKNGAHYLRTRAQTEVDHSTIEAYARRVPGLHPPDGAEPELTFPDERECLASSGLFDAAFYVGQNPGVGTSDIDPLTHYCAFGWREGRDPNPRFDTAWYLATYASEVPNGINPLLDYILRGELRGRFPAVDFDPERYRLEKRLPSGVSPLRHLLAEKLNVGPAVRLGLASRVRGVWKRLS
jgi:hypothetical protein